MRSLVQTPTPQRRSLTPQTTVNGILPHGTTIMTGTVLNAASIGPLTSANSTPISTNSLSRETFTPSLAMNTDLGSLQLRQSDTSASSTTADPLQMENILLKEEIADLRRQYKDILDHSIESDTRLLKYTNEVFSVGTSTSTDTIGVKIHSSDQYTQTEIVQSEDLFSPSTILVSLTDDHNDIRKCNLDLANRKIDKLENELTALKRPCARCSIWEEEKKNMISAIRVLEEQINAQHYPDDRTCSTWKASLIQQQSQQEIILEDTDISKVTRNHKLGETKRKKKKKKTKFKIVCSLPEIVPETRISLGKTRLPYTEIPFKSVSIVGDSHARHLAGLVKEQLQPGINVTGMCKPGAGLLVITPSSSSTPEKDHCQVLIAGANDVANGGENIILEHLETTIRQCSAVSKLIVATLPRRYDLAPNCSVNKTISLLNNYIVELCSRYKGVEVLEFANIRKNAFTSHGMHLTMRGKKILARLITEKMARFTASAPHQRQNSWKSTTSKPSVSAKPDQPASEMVKDLARKPIPSRCRGAVKSPGPSPQSPPGASTVPSFQPSRSPAHPRTLQHDSYADAVKASACELTPPRTFISGTNASDYFLGTPPSTPNKI